LFVSKEKANMFFDLPLEQLLDYRPPRIEPADFDDFWASTLAEARRDPLDVRFEPVTVGLKLVDTFDVTYAGFGGQPITCALTGITLSTPSMTL